MCVTAIKLNIKDNPNTKNSMKKRIKEIALQVGGSHYPEVGGELLQKFADQLVAECIDVIKNTPTHCASTTFQMGIVECTVAKSIEALQNHFKD